VRHFQEERLKGGALLPARVRSLRKRRRAINSRG